MHSVTGYTITEKIHESAKTLIYRGHQAESAISVVIKLLKAEYPTKSELIRLRNQYVLTRNLDLAGIVKALRLEPYQKGFALILEDFGGRSLKHYTNSEPISLNEFLKIAIQIAQILEELHHHRIIHKDIKPDNILINPVSGLIKLTDFGISSILPRETQSLKNPKALKGTLAYMSPEQTGRMNRGIDYRTDFYSLGVTFYKLLTGQLPFQATDPIQWVHYHIARPPVPPLEVNPGIPQAVSDIVLKLLAKTAEERYQSGRGLKADLETCLTQLETTGEILTFALGQRDVAERFQIPEKLYGREAEIKTLMAAFERVAGEGVGSREWGVGGAREVGRAGETGGAGEAGRQKENFSVTSHQSPVTNPQSKIQVALKAHQRCDSKSKIEMMLVTGYSGIGKSALVQEIYKPITQARGYFISGKFDQFQHTIPYSAIVSAFTGLVRQLLSESSSRLKGWREKLLAAFGGNGQVIIDVIPEVELIVGKQPDVPELGSTESQNRFNWVFQNFIRVFCSYEHPLVIFLDDLQWVDSATLKLMEVIMTDTAMQYLFLIGAYRDNEVNSTHPLIMTLEGLRKQGVTINQITLPPLALDCISHLIAETLHSDTELVKPLAELVVRKTEGNPFFVNEFLKTLHAEDLITFNPPQSPNNKSLFISSPLDKGNWGSKEGNKGGFGWQWNLAQIEESAITDNVVDLMIGKLKKLPLVAQHILRLAACVGADFDLNTLSIICEKSSNELFQDLRGAVHSGLILPTFELDSQLFIQDYKFGHDRIQQAAYALIDDAQKKAVHLQIGRLLLQNTVPELLSEKIFEIVDQLNLGVELINHQAERDEIAKLNLMAGQKALAATAYGAAFKYFNAGRQLLSADSWQNSYDLTLALYEAAAEASYLMGNFEQMEQFVEVVLTHAKIVLDKVKVYDVKIQATGAQGNPKEAIKIGLQVLKLLEVILPEQPSQLDIQRGLEETSSLLAGQEIEDLINLPEMTSPEKLAALFILSSICAFAYIAAPALLPLTVCEQVNLSIKYGNATWSTFAYATYGLVLCGIVQDIEAGYKFGQLALNLMKQLNAQKVKAKLSGEVGGGINLWKAHLRETIPILIEGYQSGVETGDFEFAGYCAFYACEHSYFSGRELTGLEREIETFNKLISQLKQETPFNWTAIFRQAILNLLNRVENPSKLIGDAYNEERSLPRAIAANDRTGLHLFYLNKLILCYLFDEKYQAAKNAVEAEQYLDGVVGALVVALFHFYDSLAHLGVFTSYSNLEKKAWINRVNTNQEKMCKWGHHASMNYLHKYYLVEAEKARVLGEIVKAEEFYERAIKGANENGFIQEEALAYELAAKFYLARGMEKIAQTYMKEAHYAYTFWGATAKVKDLESRYPQFLGKRLLNLTGITQTLSNTSTQTSTALDLLSIIKASQTFSGELVLDTLLGKLMKLVIENAGAEKGYLILEKSGQWAIAAIGAVNEAEVAVRQSIPLEQSSDVPAAIVHYVDRTQENLVLKDAADEPLFEADPYLQLHRPKSVLCVPILNQGKRLGILYLENKLVAGVFTSDRLEILKILCSQAAVSLENALLYEQLEEYSHTLERKVQERTQELQEKNEQLESTLQQLQAAQRQIIVQEKLASLGSLTAGIAHEIRNPLNFVNNYAAVSLEIVEELVTELAKQSEPSEARTVEALDETFIDLKENLAEINRQGKRAERIIQNMLMLARQGSSQPQLTDLNTLLADSIHLAYHSLRAKDPTFNISIETHYDDSLGQITVVPQNISRAFINVVENAYYAVKDKKKTIGTAFSPLILIRTINLDNLVEIHIRDNGPGIAPDDWEKIFEPFFTTKPPGEGTGLGLFLTYDIIVGQHGGEIKVDSELGVYTEFVIVLPKDALNIPNQEE